MATTVNSIVSKAGVLLNDVSKIRWTETEIVGWISEGQVEISKAFFPDACVTTDTLQLAAGAKQAAPAGCEKIIDIIRNVGGGVITQCDKDTLDKFAPGWMSSVASGSVVQWMESKNKDEFFVYPPQSATPAEVELTFASLPDAAVAGGNLSVRDIYAANVLNYVMARALSKEDEPASKATAEIYMRLALGS